jgi:hypothetical protein
MKWLIVCILALILAGPAISRAQSDDMDQPNSKQQYSDVDDAQTLKGVSYILTPVGMALEWGVMRPLHYLATKTFMAPVLSGDKGSPFFSENNNADLVPPGTFEPQAINTTNNLQASNNKTPIPVAPAGKTPAAAQLSSPSQSTLSGSQPALH